MSDEPALPNLGDLGRHLRDADYQARHWDGNRAILQFHLGEAARISAEAEAAVAAREDGPARLVRAIASDIRTATSSVRARPGEPDGSVRLAVPWINGARANLSRLWGNRDA